MKHGSYNPKLLQHRVVVETFFEDIETRTFFAGLGRVDSTSWPRSCALDHVLSPIVRQLSQYVEPRFSDAAVGENQSAIKTTDRRVVPSACLNRER